MSPMNCQSARGIFAPKVDEFISSIAGLERNNCSRYHGDKLATLGRSTRNSPTHPTTGWRCDFCQIGSQLAKKHISSPKPLYLAIKANVLSGVTNPARPALNMFKGKVSIVAA